MFEKEAEEYREKGKNEGYYLVAQEMEQEELDYIIDESFKDGAEFGYNKANEWHYVKDGDLPPEDTKVLALMANKEIYIAHFYRKNVWDKIGNIIAWKEIELPELKEDEIESEMFPEIILPEGSSEFIDKVIADAEKRVKEKNK